MKQRSARPPLWHRLIAFGMLLVMLGVSGVLPGAVAGVASLAGSHRVEISWGQDQVVVVLAHDRGQLATHHHNLGDQVAVFFASASGPQSNHIFASAMEEVQVPGDASHLETPEEPAAVDLAVLHQPPFDLKPHAHLAIRQPQSLLGPLFHARLSGVQMLL